jgi:type IV secretion system protein VirB10
MVAAAIVAFAAVAPLAAVDADRDFSGRWTLDPQASNIRALPALPERLLVIVQREMAIRCSATGEDGAAAEWSFSADGQESRYTLGLERRSAVAKWEGSALLINTLVSGPLDYSVMDRWKLSADRSLLTIERQVVRSTGQVEGTVVYRRGGQTELTARPFVPEPPRLPEKPQPPPSTGFAVRAGTRIPLTLVNTLNTKRSREGDGVYLETAFPVFIDGRMVIPRGSYVTGTITLAKQAGRVKGKSEMYIRFDSLTLPNGVARDFRSRLGSADAAARGQVDRAEGSITGEGSKTGDVRTVAGAAGMGASVGSIAGAAGHLGMGVGLGGAVGGLAGLASVLGSRGQGVVLPRGTTLEMVLDRDLLFTPEELRF